VPRTLTEAIGQQREVPFAQLQLLTEAIALFGHGSAPRVRLRKLALEIVDPSLEPLDPTSRPRTVISLLSSLRAQGMKDSDKESAGDLVIVDVGILGVIAFFRT
jgi:hypothetical protein